MSGERAFELGMVTQAVASADELDSAVDALAKRLSAGGPHALRATKKLLNTLDGSDDAEIVRRGAELSAAVLATPEARERLAANFAR